VVKQAGVDEDRTPQHAAFIRRFESLGITAPPWTSAFSPEVSVSFFPVARAANT
jgi:hypothetical protein